MSVKILNLKLNLVGFNADLVDKFSKQIDAINRMNVAQNRLQFHWEASDQAYNSPVHFVIEPSLPHYLKNSKAIILSNHNLDVDNLMTCPHPITTFDLMDVLISIEEKLPAQTDIKSQESEMVFWRAGSMMKPESDKEPKNSLISNVEQEVQKTITSPPPISEPDKEEPIFYTYGSFRKNTTAPSEQTQPTSPTVLPNDVTSNAISTNTSQVTNTVVENTAPAAIDEKPIEKKEKFILYGSLKETFKQPSNHAQESTIEAIGLNDTHATNTSNAGDRSDQSIETLIDSIDISPSEPSQEKNHPSVSLDTWDVLSQTQTGIVCIAPKNVYVDFDKKMIAADVANIQELVNILLAPCEHTAEVTNNIPDDLKSFSLSATLWSYGLHTPELEKKIEALDLDNQEWKLKGFPRFGQWETHPTWLFLATLFAQNYHSIDAAQARGKASTEQIKHFIYAAQLADLKWQTKILTPEKKQQQTSLSQMAPQKDSWITRLRAKLHINEHFESSLD